ncbi:transglutaminase domain-containing protein [Flavobacterium sp. LB3P45]|uniref:Transglutaminase domain-containing protein n=1 Tax=Flavobacterium fructosi TaxID=3230416 RepID=A0ABW6HHA3_9FLAO
MLKNIYILLSLFLSILSFGQSQTDDMLVDVQISKIPNSATFSTKDIANYINSNFKTDNDKIRAIFYWTASNISYDMGNRLTLNSKETSENKIKNILQTRKGVCGDYTEIFNDLAKKVGVKSVIISGYTKQNGVIDTISHAWCAAKINNKWYLFDPTWGSGYANNGRFFKKIDNSYFKVNPLQSISSHIPFDYLWQFLHYPITNQEFYQGRTQINKSKKYFDFENEIARYESSSEIDRLYDSAERIEKNGVENNLILERLKNKDKNISYLRQKTNVEKLNIITINCNQAITLLNDFINYRNKRFSPTLPDKEIKNMVTTPKQKLIECQNALYDMGYVGNGNSSSLASLKKSVDNALAQTEGHLLFVQNYLSKNNIARKGMFTKTIWY